MNPVEGPGQMLDDFFGDLAHVASDAIVVEFYRTVKSQ
jgi:hypothetical protein